MEIDRGRTISIIIGSLVEAELAHSPSSARTNQEQEQHDLDVRHGRVAMLANSGFLPPCLVRKIDFLVEVLKQIRERAGPSVSEEMLMAGNRLPALDTEYPDVDFTGGPMQDLAADSRLPGGLSSDESTTAVEVYNGGGQTFEEDEDSVNPDRMEDGLPEDSFDCRDIFYVSEKALMDLKGALDTGGPINRSAVKDIVLLAGLRDTDVMVPVDMRDANFDFVDVEQMISTLGPQDAAEAFMKARKEVVDNIQEGTDREYPQPMTFSEWKSIVYKEPSYEEGEDGGETDGEKTLVAVKDRVDRLYVKLVNRGCEANEAAAEALFRGEEDHHRNMEWQREFGETMLDVDSDSGDSDVMTESQEGEDTDMARDDTTSEDMATELRTDDEDIIAQTSG